MNMMASKFMRAEVEGWLYLYAIQLVVVLCFILRAEAEAEALIESGWWNKAYTMRPSSHCHWPGITCNSAGSVTHLALPSQLQVGNKFASLNFFSLPNLLFLNLSGVWTHPSWLGFSLKTPTS